MLPIQSDLSKSIKNIVDGNPYQGDKADAEKATQYFCDQLSSLILTTLKSAVVNMKPGDIKTVVTMPTGSGTGTNVIPNQGNLI